MVSPVPLSRFAHAFFLKPHLHLFIRKNSFLDIPLHSITVLALQLCLLAPCPWTCTKLCDGTPIGTSAGFPPSMVTEDVTLETKERKRIGKAGPLGELFPVTVDRLFGKSLWDEAFDERKCGELLGFPFPNFAVR
jgi:hypothetical protein